MGCAALHSALPLLFPPLLFTLPRPLIPCTAREDVVAARLALHAAMTMPPRLAYRSGAASVLAAWPPSYYRDVRTASRRGASGIRDGWSGEADGKGKGEMRDEGISARALG